MASSVQKCLRKRLKKMNPLPDIIIIRPHKTASQVYYKKTLDTPLLLGYDNYVLFLSE